VADIKIKIDRDIAAKYAVSFGSNVLMKLLLILITAGLVFSIISPIFSLVIRGFMQRQDLTNPLVYMIPINFTLENYRTAFEHMRYLDTLWLTMRHALAVTLIQTVVCALTGYGFARFNFPGRNILFGVVIMTIVVPIEAITTSLFMQFRFFDVFGIISLFTGERGINFLNTVTPLYILALTGMGVRSGLFIFIFRQFFRNMPKEFEESAFIDGAGKIRTFLSIIIPNALPAIITVFLFTLVWQYNDTTYSAILLPTVNMMPTMLGTLGNTVYTATATQDLTWVNLVVQTGAVLVIAPMIIIYLFLQKLFSEGVERSGITG